MTVHDGNYKYDKATSIVTSYSRSTTEMTSCVCSCTQHIKYNVSTETVSCLYKIHVKSCRSLVKATHSVGHQIVLLLLATGSNIESKECLTLYLNLVYMC